MEQGVGPIQMFAATVRQTTLLKLQLTISNK